MRKVKHGDTAAGTVSSTVGSKKKEKKRKKDPGFINNDR